jgi:hypothetical protein
MYDMKKKYTVLILISFAMGVIFSLMLMLPLAEKKLQKSISDDRNNTITEMNELSDILRLYNLFLKNEVGSNNKKGESYFLKDYCNNFNKLDKTGNGVRYALFDMTNDGIPELHVLTDISYSVHTVEGKKLITWYEGDRYRRPLNNKAILGKTESSETYYEYIVLDNKGEEVFSCAFAKNQRNICLFSNGEDYIKLSKRKWEKLTSPFLSIGSDKINWKNINDKVEWTELKGK